MILIINNELSKLPKAEAWQNLWWKMLREFSSFLNPTKWSFGENLDTIICIIIVLPHLKKNAYGVILHIFKTMTFSLLSTVLYQSGVTMCWWIVLPAGNGVWSIVKWKTFSYPDSYEQTHSDNTKFHVNSQFPAGVNLCPAKLHHFKISHSLQFLSRSKEASHW